MCVFPVSLLPQGVIWSAVSHASPTREEVAVKKLPNALDEVLASKRLLRELRLLRHLRHENIIGLKDGDGAQVVGVQQETSFLFELSRSRLR